MEQFKINVSGCTMHEEHQIQERLFEMGYKRGLNGSAPAENEHYWFCINNGGIVGTLDEQEFIEENYPERPASDFLAPRFQTRPHEEDDMKLDSTPGPWTWTGYNLMGNGSIDDTDYRNQVASDGSAGGEYGESIDIKGPDARLIAAAPEMLEALIRFTRGISSVNERGEIMKFEGEGDDVISFPKALQVIEKATGKTWEELDANQN